MPAQVSGALLVTFAVIQTLVLLGATRFLDLYEHEPLRGVAAMAVWGAIGATSLTALGQLSIPATLGLSETVEATVVPPAIEEVSKGAALVVAFGFAWWMHRRFGTKPLRGVTDGLVYGVAVGLGFAFTEDIYFLLSQVADQVSIAASDRSLGSEAILEQAFATFVERREFLGLGMLQHAIFSGTFGIGLGLASWSSKWHAKVAYITGGLGLAIALHSFNNFFSQRSTIEAAGLSLTEAARLFGLGQYLIFVAFAWAAASWLSFQRRVIRAELKEEVKSGLIDARDAELVPRFIRRNMWYLELARVREFERSRVFRALHVQLANHSLLRWRAKRSPREAEALAQSRQRIANLKAELSVDVYAPHEA